MRTANTESEETHKTRSLLHLSAAKPFVLVAFSIFYFAYVWLLASEKYFWYDELFTVYLCRLPSFNKLWDALRHGVDYHPPLIYLLTRLSNAIFGEGLIATRLPAIFGFWTFCLCLFRFVNGRAGLAAGVVAMLLPVLSGALYYAYEARPYGLVLGFCGLALVFWQMAVEEPKRKRWVLAFGASIFALLMTHCYAVLIIAVFGITEIFRTIQARRINRPIWIALLLPCVPAVWLYAYYFLAFKSVSQGTHVVSHNLLVASLPRFYFFLFGPCIVIVLLLLVVLALNSALSWSFATPPRTMLTRNVQAELVLAVFLAALPAFGLLFVRAIQVPFFDRYFVAAIAGFCVMIGFGAGAGKSMNWAVLVLALVMASNAAWRLSKLAWHRHQGWADIVEEPSSRFSMNVSVEGPLERYSLLLSRSHNSLRIGLLDALDVLYLSNYAPGIRSRLFYIKRADDDFFYYASRKLHPWLPQFSPGVTREEFLRVAPHCLIYGLDQVSELGMFIERGASVRWATVSNGRFLAELEMTRKQQ